MIYTAILDCTMAEHVRYNFLPKSANFSGKRFAIYWLDSLFILRKLNESLHYSIFLTDLKKQCVFRITFSKFSNWPFMGR